MTDLFTTWWAWVTAGLVLAILELLLPGYIFLGFALGAVVTGLLLGLGFLPAGLPLLLVIFAALSALAYVALRATFKLDRGQVKVITRDINDN